MNLNEQFEKALIIATEAHAGQTRWNGEPYILHPLRVASRLNDLFLKIIAILHDVIEDSYLDTNDLLQKGINKQIVEVVHLLTRRENNSYEEYIDYISSNFYARTVKREDLRDNMNIFNIPELNNKHFSRLIEYRNALDKLQY